MSLSSMTGFGRATLSRQGWLVTVHANSVNRKHLDVSINLPRKFQPLESALVREVRGRLHRGRVTLAVEIQASDGSVGSLWNEDAVSASLIGLRKLAGQNDIPFRPDLVLLLQLAETTKEETSLPDLEALEAVAAEAVGMALEELVAMRRTEGEALALDLREKLANVENLIAAIGQRAPSTPVQFRQALLQRLQQMDLALDVNDERVLKEVAIFADRVDINEELVRLQSHVSQMAEILGQSGQVGRRLDFLVQEISRETHTIGSKNSDLTISRYVLELKNEIERMREQLQNVE